MSNNILYLILLIISIRGFFLQAIIYKRKEEELRLSKDYPLFLKYLDRYYITNMPYTIFANIMYILLMLAPFVILRYISLGSLTEISWVIEEQRISKAFILYLVGILFLIILYRSILKGLLFREVLKLHLYLDTTIESSEELYTKVRRLVVGESFITVLTNIVLHILDKNCARVIDYDDKPIVLPIIAYGQELCEDNKFILEIFIVLARLCTLVEFLWEHLMIKKIYAELCLMVILISEISVGSLYYIYYYLFIYLLIVNIRHLKAYIKAHIFLEETFLRVGIYFYSNKVPYSYQRYYILSHFIVSETYQNRYLEDFYNDVEGKKALISFVITGAYKSEEMKRLEVVFSGKSWFKFAHRLFIALIMTYVTLLTSNICKEYLLFMIISTGMLWSIYIYEYSRLRKPHNLGESISKVIFVTIVIIQGYIVCILFFFIL